MAFIESRLLDCPGFGYTGGPGASTDVITVRSGHEQRQKNWAQMRHRFELGLMPRPKLEFDLIRAAFMICNGRWAGFRLQDFHDFECDEADGVLIPLVGGLQVGGAGAGYGTPTYQLAKVYARGSSSYIRDIFKPVAGSVVVFVDASPAAPAIATSTGIVTFSASQSKVIDTHTVGAAHIIDLASAFSPNFAVGERVFITGVVGTAASALNDKSHEITNVAADVLTIATNTVGLTATGGTASFYPQAGDALTWSGEFDVPVRFDIDQFDAVVVNKNATDGLLVELPSVPIVETRDIA